MCFEDRRFSGRCRGTESNECRQGPGNLDEIEQKFFQVHSYVQNA